MENSRKKGGNVGEEKEKGKVVAAIRHTQSPHRERRENGAPRHRGMVDGFWTAEGADDVVALGRADSGMALGAVEREEQPERVPEHGDPAGYVEDAFPAEVSGEDSGED